MLLREMVGHNLANAFGPADAMPVPSAFEELLARLEREESGRASAERKRHQVSSYSEHDLAQLRRPERFANLIAISLALAAGLAACVHWLT